MQNHQKIQTAGEEKPLQNQRLFSSHSAFLFFTGGLILIFSLLLFLCLYFIPRYYPDVKDHVPAEYFFACAIGAGQFDRPPDVYITPRCPMGEKLMQINFPGTFTVDAGLFSKKQFFRNMPEKFLYDEENREKGRADIVIAVPRTVSFPSDAFLTYRHLFPLKEKLVRGGVFILLLPHMKSDHYQQIIDHLAPQLCMIYKNVLPVAFPRMLLASDRVPVTDPEKLEKKLFSFTGEESSPFPESFLSIFTSGLPRSRVLKASSETVFSPSEKTVPFPWVFREKYHEGFMGDIWYLFRLWTGFFQQYFYYCWGGLILFYFVLRYFCSPGEKRKRFFHFFEECFFLAGLPACVFMASPGKWEKNTIILFSFLVPLLCIFFSMILFLAEKMRKESGTGLFSGRRIFYFSLPAILVPLLVLAIYQGVGEKFVSEICSSFLPQGMQSIVLLLLLAGSIANSCLFHNTLKGMCFREIPLLLLIPAALFAVFLLISAAGYGGISCMVIPLVLMSIVQFSSSYRM